MPQINDELIGKTLKQTYTITGYIGRGGMGKVYRAQQVFPSREVAIKVFKPREPIDDYLYHVLAQRFWREAQLYGTFRHANIMSIFEYGEQDDLLYIVMPYFSRGNLYELFLGRRGRPLPSDETLHYLQQAALALEQVHARRVVHRDIKPSNFLRGDDRQLVLSDFGVAHTSESTLTGSGEFLGTHDYAAPEVIDGGTFDHRADVYSLGVILFQMVTGKAPYHVHRLAATIPSPMGSVVRKATAHRPEDRYNSAGELAEALRDAIMMPSLRYSEHNAPTEPAGIHVPPPMRVAQPRLPHVPSPAHRTTPGTKLFRRVLVLIFLVMLLLIGGIIFIPILTGTSPFSFLQPPTPTPTLTPELQAKAAVQQYYDNWNKGNEGGYQAAYNLLDTGYQKTYPYKLSDYNHTKYSCVTINSTMLLPDGSFRVAVIVNAIEYDASSSTGTVINAYTFNFIVKQEQGSWRLMPEENPQRLRTHGMCQAP